MGTVPVIIFLCHNFLACRGILRPFPVSLCKSNNIILNSKIIWTKNDQQNSPQDSQVSIGAAEDVVGTQLLVGGAVAVEPPSEAEGQRIVGHEAVGTVPMLQLLQLETLAGTVAAGGDQQADCR